jgi:serine/threonine protein kinase
MRVMGGFRISEAIAEGAHATVHVVYGDDDDERALVAKVAKPGHEGRLHHEWDLRDHVRHDHIARPIALVTDGREVALVSPRAAHSLQRCVGALSDGEVASVLDDVAAALVVLHDAGFAHCDLRPCNVLLDHDGRALVCDLGSAAPSTAELEAADANALARLGDALLADAFVDGPLGALLLDGDDPRTVAELRDQVRAIALAHVAPAPTASPLFVSEPPTVAIAFDVTRRIG